MYVCICIRVHKEVCTRKQLITLSSKSRGEIGITAETKHDPPSFLLVLKESYPIDLMFVCLYMYACIYVCMCV